MRLLVTRPQPEAQHFAKRLAAAGHKTVIAPLLEIQAVAEEDADIFADVDALAITSARTFDFLQPTETARALPVFAVGAATAAAARAVGFRQVEEAAGNAVALASLLRRRLTPGKVVLNPGGRDQARDPSQLLAGSGLVLIRRIVYQACQAPVLPPAAVTALDEGRLDAATFFSPRTSRTFVRLAQEAGLIERTEPLLAFCLSPTVAAGLRGSAWKDVLCAQQPDSAGLLQSIASRACGGNSACGGTGNDKQQVRPWQAHDADRQVRAQPPNQSDDGDAERGRHAGREQRQDGRGQDLQHQSDRFDRRCQ